MRNEDRITRVSPRSCLHSAFRIPHSANSAPAPLSSPLISSSRPAPRDDERQGRPREAPVPDGPAGGTGYHAPLVAAVSGPALGRPPTRGGEGPPPGHEGRG